MNIERSLSREQVQQWAIESLRDPLALSFSHCVADCVDWNKARFRVLVGADIPEKDMLDFEPGGKTSGMLRPDDWLVESLKEARAQGDSFLLFEDWGATPEGRFLVDYSMPAVFHGREVYYVVNDRNPERLPNWGRIHSNSPPLFHGFIVQGYQMPSPGSILEKKHLETLAQYVQMAIFGVYDGESYLLCSFEDTGSDLDLP